ncbi:MAG: invasion associated locus B family protein [Alphaproteobacteria bacterium]
MRIIFALALFLLATTPASAQQKGLIDVFANWSAFAIKESGQPVCYIGSEPNKQQGKYNKRGDTYVLVTLRPSDKKTPGVVSLTAGYTYKKNSDVYADIGKNRFKMFGRDGTAWAYKDADDAAMIVAMKRGATLIVNGISSRGTKTTDTYSLTGFTAAYNAARAACK